MKELVEQWEDYKDFLNRLIGENKLGYSYYDSLLNFRDFMIWVETGRLKDGTK